MVACKLGNEMMVAMLLEKGSDIGEKDFLGRNARGIAERYKQPRVLQILSAWELYGSIPTAYKSADF